MPVNQCQRNPTSPAWTMPLLNQLYPDGFSVSLINNTNISQVHP